MLKIRFYLLIFFLCFTVELSGGENLSSLWRTAEENYDLGHYQKALDAYELILAKSGEDRNGHLFYNLGNTYYRLGKTGEAMAAYLAARSLLPRNPDVLANLKFMTGRISDKLSVNLAPSFWSYLSFWQGAFTIKELYFSMICSFCLSFLLLGLFFLKRKWFVFLRSAQAFFVLSFLLASSFALSFSYVKDWAAVSSEEAKVLSGPGKLNTTVFELHKAAPLRVIRKQNSYFLIEISDGKKGWIAAKNIKFFPTRI